jgi:hypothetical protein
MPFVEFAWFARRLDSTGFLLSFIKGAGKETPAKPSDGLNLATLAGRLVKQGGGKIRL